MYNLYMYIKYAQYLYLCVGEVGGEVKTAIMNEERERRGNAIFYLTSHEMQQLP